MTGSTVSPRPPTACRQPDGIRRPGELLDKRTDAKVISADGSTTETVADTSSSGTLIDETVTTVSSDGKTKTVQGDNDGTLKNGAPVFDRVETIALQANGSIIDTVSD